MAKPSELLALLQRATEQAVQTGRTEPPEIWTFLATNVIILLFGGVLAVMSYVAYRRKGSRHFSYATVGFVLVTLGGVTELIYQTGIKRSYSLGGRELLAVQSVQSLLIGIGLAVLFYSIYSFSPHRRDHIEWHEEPGTESEADSQPKKS